MAHPRAKLTVAGRRLLVQRVLEQGWPPARAAEAQGVSLATAYKCRLTKTSKNKPSTSACIQFTIAHRGDQPAGGRVALGQRPSTEGCHHADRYGRSCLGDLGGGLR